MPLIRSRLSPRSLGVGLVAGASDNDPTTVATMVVAGATTVYSLSWLTLLLFPMLASVLVIAAQVGLGSRCGLLTSVQRQYGRGLALLLLVSVLAVNLITLGADLEAGAASLALLFGGDLRWFVLPYSVLLIAMLMVGSQRFVQRLLKYTIAIFSAYVIAAFLARPDWQAVLRATVAPSVSLRADYLEAALAILGTTLTSYSYVWETQQVAEEKGQAGSLNNSRVDAALGTLVAVITFWFILIATGATLGVHHQQANTAQDAAAALRPFAGSVASDLFAVGLLSSSLVALPVLATCSAYLLDEQLQAGISSWPDAARSKALRAAAASSILIGAGISFSGAPPIQLLYWASIAGGLGTPVGVVLLLLVARNRNAMGSTRVGWPLVALGWLTAALITIVSVVFVWQQATPLLAALTGHGRG